MIPRPTVTKRRNLGGELTNEQWDIIHDALIMFADSCDGVLQDEAAEPGEHEDASLVQADANAIAAMLEARGLDGRSLQTGD